jgi:hypothetical protein
MTSSPAAVEESEVANPKSPGPADVEKSMYRTTGNPSWLTQSLPRTAPSAGPAPRDAAVNARITNRANIGPRFPDVTQMLRGASSASTAPYAYGGLFDAGPRNSTESVASYPPDRGEISPVERTGHAAPLRRTLAGPSREPDKELSWTEVLRQLVLGTVNDPGAIRLGWEWLSETGPQSRILNPDSRFSQRFRQSQAAQRFENELLRKYNGSPPNGGYMFNFDDTFKLQEFLTTINLPQNFLGSVQDGNAYVKDGVAHFSFKNNSNLRSLSYGRVLNKYGFGSFAPPPRSDFGPGGETTQVIQWSTPVERLGRVP